MEAAAAALHAERRPERLAPDQREFLASIADTIIPRTQTPGATDVSTVDFIEFMYQRGMPADARAQFRLGLDALAQDSKSALRDTYATAPLSARIGYLESIDHELFTFPHDAARKSLLDFFATVKRLTVIGYYTAKDGAAATLDVELFPGEFRGENPVTAGTRTFYEDSFGVPLERPVGYLMQHD
jgi:gluconate 2-dehydrogenase gamma chain